MTETAEIINLSCVGTDANFSHNLDEAIEKGVKVHYLAKEPPASDTLRLDKYGFSYMIDKDANEHWFAKIVDCEDFEIYISTSFQPTPGLPAKEDALVYQIVDAHSGSVCSQGYFPYANRDHFEARILSLMIAVQALYRG